MIKTSIEKLADDIGFDIAHSDDETQAKLLNGLFRGLHNGMDKHSLQTQVCYIVDKLNNTSHEVMKLMMDFIRLKEEGDK